MPLDVALAGVRAVVDAVDLPVSADLDDGDDDPGETVRRAIGLGVVGADVGDRLGLPGALRDLAEDLHADGVVPPDTPALN